LPRQFEPTASRGLASGADIASVVNAAADDVSSADDRPDDAACRGPADYGSDSTDGSKAVDVLPSTTELVDVLCPDEDVPLSTAAHLSARFPYASPTGRIERKPCTGNSAGLIPAPAVSFDLDGGIFDNSGAGTALDTWRALEPLAGAAERESRVCLAPIFIQIDNSPPAATVATTVDAPPFETLAPVTSYLGELGSRESYARAGAASAFARAVSPSGHAITVSPAPRNAGQQSFWQRIVLYGQPGPKPPLGWTLARETIDDMRRQLQVPANAEAIKALRGMLQPGALGCSP
jgi:hypothetical protein